MWKFNCFPSIRPFLVPLDKGSHSLGQPTISRITLHFYHCFYDRTSPICFPSTAVKQRSSETLMKQQLLAYQSLDPELWEEGSAIQGLGCMLGSSLCCWRGGGGLSPAWVLLPQWKWLWSKVSKDKQQVDASLPWRETLKCHQSETHDTKIEDTAKHCTQRISGCRLPRWHWERQIQQISKESLQICPSRTMILPGMLLKYWWMCPS